jgi:tetratricopeptide (TPR) repeat protein
MILKAFISHSTANDAYVAEMVQYLRALGYDDVFNDGASIFPDEESWPRITTEIDACDAFVVVLSAASVQSMWVAKEIAYAREKNRRVIPLWIEDCELPEQFQLRDVVDFRPQSRQATLAKLKPNNLPYNSLGSLFKGRDTFLTQLHERLRQSNRATVITTKPQAVYGAGGVGKTRTAIEYAWKFAAEYTALLFITADSPQQFEASLVQLTRVLRLAEYDTKPDDERLQAVFDWLQTHPHWLLIIDNVDSTEAALAVREKLALLSQGHVLITSRITKWSNSFDSLELDLLEVSAGRDYLLEKTTDRRPVPHDASLAEEIVKLVGQLALGLEHAAAYINAHGLTLEKYIELWNTQQSNILQYFDTLQIDYPRALLVTWKMSVDQLSSEAQLLLEMLAWFSPEPIPETILDALPEGFPLNAAHEKLAELERYSLIKRKREQAAFSVHRLVQATTRHHLERNQEQLRETLTQALLWLDAAFQGEPQDVRDWSVLEPLQLHVAHLCQIAVEHKLYEQQHLTTRLMNDSALLYKVKAKYTSAEPLYRKALELDEATHGKTHTRVAIDLNNLASLLLATNRLTEAEPLMRRALAIDEATYGKTHPRVAADLNNLAQLLQATNRLSEAEPLMERALAIDEASFGKDHQKVAIRLNNLASLLRDTNRLAEAEPLMRRALAIDESAFGKDHPSVAIRLNNLAQLLQDTNRLTEAEPLMRRALTIDEVTFGKEHPKVAIRLNNLAQLLQDTNRLTEAEPLMRRALAIDEASFGKEHPKVANRLNNLASLLRATNRLTEAEPLMRRALICVIKSLGVDHPNSETVLGNYYAVLEAMGKSEEEILTEFKTLLQNKESNNS